jgi:PLP dependent protein
MAVHAEKYLAIKKKLDQQQVTLIAVSKTKPVEDILALYELGQRHFGENYVQELVAKQAVLPNDIHWHFIGHLQSNKVKYITPFVYLIHGVDSGSLLQEINKQAQKHNRVINCLLQVHIAREETKFGLDEAECTALLTQPYANITLCGLMGMASFSDDMQLVKHEFTGLTHLFENIRHNHPLLTQTFTTISMGMSADYEVAIAAGSNMVRIGSLLFGERNKPM